MPLVFQEPFDPPGEWGLWHIDEPEAGLRAALHLYGAEEEQLHAIRGEERRREFLAARLLLHRMSGRESRGELVKDPSGKPHLVDSDFFVSISHTVDFSAALAHPRACGVDVQRIVPRITRIAPRFIAPAESARLVDEHRLLQQHLIWSAKEAMYKAYGLRQIDFRAHLTVDLGEDFHPGSTTGRAVLQTEDCRMTFDLRLGIFDGFVLVGAVADASVE